MDVPALSSIGNNKQITYFQVFVHLTDFIGSLPTPNSPEMLKSRRNNFLWRMLIRKDVKIQGTESVSYAMFSKPTCYLKHFTAAPMCY